MFRFLFKPLRGTIAYIYIHTHTRVIISMQITNCSAKEQNTQQGRAATAGPKAAQPSRSRILNCQLLPSPKYLTNWAKPSSVLRHGHIGIYAKKTRRRGNGLSPNRKRFILWCVGESKSLGTRMDASRRGWKRKWKQQNWRRKRRRATLSSGERVVGSVASLFWCT